MQTSEWIVRVASSCDKQFYLRDLVSDLDWHIDLASGLLSFGNQYSWRVQLLGTESESVGTWLWAWANAASRIPDNLLHASLTMKAFGEQHGISELTESEVPLTNANGHAIALLASEVYRADGYYLCPYDGVVLFVLISDETFPKCADPPFARITTVFPQVISLFEIPDHRLAFTGYLAFYGLGFEQDERQVVVKQSGEVVLAATFDEQNRLTHLQAELGTAAVQPESEESWDVFVLRQAMRGS